MNVERPTGLLKRCPRCGRLGEVFATGDHCGPTFAIVWVGPGRSPFKPKSEPDRDELLRTEDLLNPNTGCGYDSAPVGDDAELRERNRRQRVADALAAGCASAAKRERWSKARRQTTKRRGVGPDVE